MLDDRELLKYFIESELLVARPLLPASSFVKFCKDRGVSTSIEQLERLEELGILSPVARIERPKYPVKVEYTSDRKQYRPLGRLQDGEEWSGDTIEEYSGFSFRRDFAEGWMEEGRLWAPSARPFAPWATFKGDSWCEKTTSFYSEFQCYSLQQFHAWSRMTSGAEWEFDRDDNAAQKLRSQVRKWAQDVIQAFQRNSQSLSRPAMLCQAIANRYYFNTQGDRRTITVSSGAEWPSWDWHEYCRKWKAQDVLNNLQSTAEEVRQIQMRLCSDARSVDPLARWYDLVRFVSLQKKQRLRGPALRAQLLYTMEHMLRLFYRDLTGEKLYPPDESPIFTRDTYYGDGIPDDERQYLEFLANEYHLNPKPRLILVVEGESEEQHLPRLVERMFGVSFSKLGIEVFNIRGVTQFEGKKRLERYGALEKFIDDHHARQTIVHVVLDKEGRASRVASRLAVKRSQRCPWRTVTKPEYLCFWSTSIEFDNFTDAELAEALTRLGNGEAAFTETQVKACREDPQGRQLERLYDRNGGKRFSKTRLFGILVDMLIENVSDRPSKDGDQAERPIVREMRRVVDLASMNHPAVTYDIWKRNQESGYLGDPMEPKVDASSGDRREDELKIEPERIR